MILILSMKKVIVLTGMPGSGKSTAGIEFSKLDVPLVGMGDAVRKEMHRRGIEINNRSLRLLFLKLLEDNPLFLFLLFQTFS